MKLDQPSLPVVVSKEEAQAQITEEIAAKGWSEEEIQAGELSLLYVPFFIFNYEAFQETKTEESEQAVVSETEHGRMALNAFDSELDESVAQLFEEEETNLEKKTPKEVEFEIQKNRLTIEEAKQLAQIKMAAQLSLGKENIIISAMELLYVPIWVSSANIAEQEYRIEINAVSGELSGLEELPERGKTYGELAKETVSELKDPVAWAKYFFSIIADTAKWIWNTAPVKYVVNQLSTNRQWQIAVLICIIILVGLKEAGYI